MSTENAPESTNAAHGPSGSAGLSARQVQIRGWIQAVGMLPVLIIIGIAFHFLSDGRFFTAQNLSIVAQQASINTVLAAGMTFVILTGGIDLSVGSMLAVSAMTGVIVSLIPGFGMLGIPAAMLTGLFFGFLNGVMIAFLKLPPFIVTLGSLTAVRGIARLIGRDTTVFNADLPFAAIGNEIAVRRDPLACDYRLPRRADLLVRAAPDGARRSHLCGRRQSGRGASLRHQGLEILMFVYCTSGLFSGLGGVMTVARLYAANGLQIGQAYELDAIAAVILGGTSFVGGIGSIWGTLIGALIIAVLSNGLILLGVSDIWQFIIKGLVIIGAVGLDRFRSQGGGRT